jgi:hypothetical protein
MIRYLPSTNWDLAHEAGIVRQWPQLRKRESGISKALRSRNLEQLVAGLATHRLATR